MSGVLLQRQQVYGNRYRVAEFCGEGGMQEVYVADDTVLGKRVALKVPKNSAALRRFQRSAILSAKVNHPNVAKTLDYFEEGGKFFLAEEYIPGLDLAKFRAALPQLDPWAVAHVLHHLAKAIAASHHVGVVHRDLKPSNVMVDGEFRLDSIKVTDFGIAQMAEQEMLEAGEVGFTLTSSHTILGALPYLSPEMVQSTKDASFPTDIWSLGAMAYELLTGQKPFGGKLAAVAAILSGPLPKLPSELLANSQFAPLVEDVYTIILQCLQRDISMRTTADQLVEACERLCYQTARREVGLFTGTYKQSRYITPASGGREVFFHFDSVFGSTPALGDRVWYCPHVGTPKYRAHPVVRMLGNGSPE